jgi:hypothetical protein
VCPALCFIHVGKNQFDAQELSLEHIDFLTSVCGCVPRKAFWEYGKPEGYETYTSELACLDIILMVVCGVQGH